MKVLVRQIIKFIFNIPENIIIQNKGQNNKCFGYITPKQQEIKVPQKYFQP